MAITTANEHENAIKDELCQIGNRAGERHQPVRRCGPKLKCSCPIYCRYCGRRRSRDAVGHYCKTPNCQNQHGYAGCDLYERKRKEG